MAKSKKEEKKKRLRMLILLLFVTIVMLATSTYAWFTSNRTVQIEDIDVHVAASSGLQISTDGEDWKTLIQNADINAPTNYSTHINQLPYELVPVSTAGETSSGYLKFFRGVVEGDMNQGGALALTANQTLAEHRYVKTGMDGDNAVYTNATRPEFIAFDIFIKVDNAAGEDIYLDTGSGVTSTANKADKHLQFASRYAFVRESNAIADGSALSSIQTPNLGTDVIIIEPNYDGHTVTGVTAANSYYNQTVHDYGNNESILDNGSSTEPALAYMGVKAAIPSPIVLVNTNPGGNPSSTYFQDVTDNADLIWTNTAYSKAGTTIKSFTNGTADTVQAGATAVSGEKDSRNLHFLFHLDQGITKYRFYMWVEGQDVDCENNASGDDISFDFQFTTTTS